MTGRLATPRRRLDPLWILVGAGAALVRALIGLLVPVTPYSGDSWCLLHLGGAPLCASHPPTITWIWRTLTLGAFTETSVLVLQGVLGVVAALAMFGLLRQVADRRVAAAAALASSLVPVTLFMERAIMTESIQDLLFVLGLLAGLAALRAPTRRSALGWVATAALALGMAAAIHSAATLTAIGVTGLLVVMVLWRQASLRTAGSVASLVAIPLVALGLLVAPSIPMSLRYHATFGVLSSQAMGGTYLAASWAPLLSCPAPADATPPVAAFYAVACTHHGFGSPPGEVAKLMWAPSLAFLRTAPGPGQRHAYAAAQSTLSSAALSGIVHHPVAFGAEIARSLEDQLFGRAWTRPLHVYDTGSATWRAAQADHGRWGQAVRAWFGGTVPAGGRPTPSLAAAVERTDRLPQAVLWLVLLAGLARTIAAERRRRREGRPLGVRGWWRRPPSDRVAVGLLASTVLASTMVSWALGSWPLFRIWAPLVPAVAILAALVVPPHGTGPRRRPTAGDEPEGALAG